MDEENMDYPLIWESLRQAMGKMPKKCNRIDHFSLTVWVTPSAFLTEDPVAEIPVAQDLANRAQEWWSSPTQSDSEVQENVDPYTFTRRSCLN